MSEPVTGYDERCAGCGERCGVAGAVMLSGSAVYCSWECVAKSRCAQGAEPPPAAVPPAKERRGSGENLHRIQ